MVRFLKNGEVVVRRKEGILEISPLATRNGEITQIMLVNNQKIFVEESIDDVCGAIFDNTGLLLQEISKPSFVI